MTTAACRLFGGLWQYAVGVKPPEEKKNVALDGKVSILKKISEKILTSICHGVPQELGIEK
jgi:hypothetical protein